MNQQDTTRAAFEAIKHSIQQARIPGNDWRRELRLIEATCRAALQSQDMERLQFIADEGCAFDTHVQEDGSCKYRLMWPNYEEWEYQAEWFDSPEEAIDHARRIGRKEK